MRAHSAAATGEDSAASTMAGRKVTSSPCNGLVGQQSSDMGGKPMMYLNSEKCHVPHYRRLQTRRISSVSPAVSCLSCRRGAPRIIKGRASASVLVGYIPRCRLRSPLVCHCRGRLGGCYRWRRALNWWILSGGEKQSNSQPQVNIDLSTLAEEMRCCENAIPFVGFLFMPPSILLPRPLNPFISFIAFIVFLLVRCVRKSAPAYQVGLKQPKSYKSILPFLCRKKLNCRVGDRWIFLPNPSDSLRLSDAAGQQG